jgi:hypothetical protein
MVEFKHDPLCPFIEDTDGIIYGWNACQCDLIIVAREQGYDAGLEEVRKYALSLLDTELHLINEEIVIEAIVGCIDSLKQIG